MSFIHNRGDFSIILRKSQILFYINISRIFCEFVLYLTRHKYEARNRDDRNFGGPKIWRNLAKTVTFRTSQKIKEFSSV